MKTNTSEAMLCGSEMPAEQASSQKGENKHGRGYRALARARTSSGVTDPGRRLLCVSECCENVRDLRLRAVDQIPSL